MDRIGSRDSTEGASNYVAVIEKGLKYVRRDIAVLREHADELEMSFPQILLVFSGIEYLSALLYSKGKYSDKVADYMSEWMPTEYDRQEGNASLGLFLYDSLRSGLVHYGNAKGDIVVDHDEEAREYHLEWVLYNGKHRLFLHGDQLAQDFEESVEQVLAAIQDGRIALDTLDESLERLKEELRESRRRVPPTSNMSLSSNAYWPDSQGRALPKSATGTTSEGLT